MASRALAWWISSVLLTGCATSPLLAPGGERTMEDTLEATDGAWLVAPFLHEVPRQCPLPVGVAAIPSPHHAYTFTVGDAPVVVGLTLERPEGGSIDTSLIAYSGGLPSSADTARQCLGVATASGPFPAVITDLHLDAGAEITVVVYDFPGAGRTRYRLLVRVSPA